MSLRTPRAARRAVGTLRDAVVEMVVEGGTLLETTVDGTPVARTVVQPNGSSIWTLTPAPLGDPDLARRHVEMVSAWHARLREAVGDLAGLLRATSRLIAAVVALATGLGSWATTSEQLLGAAVAVGVFVAVRAALARLLPRLVAWWLRGQLGRAQPT